jgi:peptidoglycan/xylan/chitin deacetylase (PgdA/CDA1 family)
LKPTIAIKSFVASCFLSLGIISAKIRHRSTDGLILMYHRIIPRHEVGDALQAGMYVAPETFKIHVRFLLKHFRIVSLPELSDALRNRPGHSNYKPLCALTFDDGWCDFSKYAFPVLRRYSVPATVFLPTDFIGTDARFWTDRLGYLLYKRNKSDVRNEVDGSLSYPLVKQLTCLKGSLESKMEQAVEMLKACRTDEIESILSELSKKWHLHQNPPGRAFLSWDEVREMRRSGLVSYGSHTATHRILTTLTDKEIKQELINSKERLITEKAVDVGCIPFCYPNGNYTSYIIKIVRESGYSLAVTTENGWNGKGTDTFCLRRIPIHQDMTSSAAMLAGRVTGII